MAKLQIAALTSFSCLQLCTALPLSMIIKDCVQFLRFSKIERTFFDRYLDTGKQGKHLLPPPSDVFCGVCLKHVTFAKRPLLIAIWFSCQMWFSSLTPSGATYGKQSLIYQTRCLRGTSSLFSSTWSSLLQPYPRRDMERGHTAQSTLSGAGCAHQGDPALQGQPEALLLSPGWVGVLQLGPLWSSARNADKTPEFYT